MSLFAFLAIGLAASAARKVANERASRVINSSKAGIELGIQEVT